MVLFELFQNLGLFLYKQASPILYYADCIIEKYYTDAEIDTKDDIKHSRAEYHYDYDIIYLRYEICDKRYIFCVNRINAIDIKTILETELEEIKEVEDFVIMAELNGKDITHRVNMYIGSDGSHIRHNDIAIQWFLGNL